MPSPAANDVATIDGIDAADPLDQQLPDTVAAYLREQILTGKVRKGEFLRLDAIARQLRMSTTPVREGLRLLHGENFVRLVPRRGFIVIGFSRQDIRDVFIAQAALGGELAARAATRITPDQLAELEKIQAELEAAHHAKDQQGVARVGHLFHRAINRAADARRLAQLLGAITKQLPNRFYATVEAHVKELHSYHPLIIDALRRRDADAARSFMFHHIARGGDHLVDMLARQGLFDEPASGDSVRALPARRRARGGGGHPAP